MVILHESTLLHNTPTTTPRTPATASLMVESIPQNFSKVPNFKEPLDGAKVEETKFNKANFDTKFRGTKFEVAK